MELCEGCGYPAPLPALKHFDGLCLACALEEKIASLDKELEEILWEASQDEDSEEWAELVADG